jgi:magnesium-transporting ATPase (P-type)
MTNLSELLEPIAAWFRSLGIPKPITHWGHPVMMGIVVLVMGSYVAYAGWRSRLEQDKEVAAKHRADHRKLAPLMFLFLALGYTGGILSLVMQRQPILESGHFWTGTIAIGLLTLTSTLSLSGFFGDKAGLRMLHAYLGTVIMGLLLVHGVLGVKLGLSI